MSHSELHLPWVCITGTPEVLLVGSTRTIGDQTERLLPNWEMGMVVSGQVHITIDDQSVTLSDEDYFILPPDTPHTLYGEGEILYAFFDAQGKFMDLPMSDGKEEVLVPLCSHERPIGYLPLTFTMQQLVREWLKGQAAKGLYNNVLSSLLYQLNMIYLGNRMAGSKQEILAEQVMSFLLENFSETINHHVLEEVFGQSYRKLNHVFTQQYDKTIHQKLTELRIQYAAGMLLHRADMTTVAERSGLGDYFYFIKVFHRETGMTPGEFKRMTKRGAVKSISLEKPK
jgi:AraC-like DNA-binding protein